MEEKQEADAVALVLSYTSSHLEEGYPGNLNTIVSYRLTDNNTLEVAYKATTDRKTIVNLTQHSYFNLSGQFQNNVLDHELKIRASRILEVDEELIPTGKFCAVEKTPFDFKLTKAIGQDMFNKDQLLKYGKGYDHCYCFDSSTKPQKEVATLHHLKSGRRMEIHTTAPAMQLYTGNHLSPPFVPYGAVCLETQGYPDSPNQANFPSPVLQVGEEYRSTTQFKFSTT